MTELSIQCHLPRNLPKLKESLGLKYLNDLNNNEFSLEILGLLIHIWVK